MVRCQLIMSRSKAPCETRSIRIGKSIRQRSFGPVPAMNITSRGCSVSVCFDHLRLTELHCGGIATRVMPHTAELQPEAFVEISSELAAIHGIETLDWVVLCTGRGEIEVKAMVTQRLRPFRIDGRVVHQIAVPWVFGWNGFAHGDIANVLLAIMATLTRPFIPPRR